MKFFHKEIAPDAWKHLYAEFIRMASLSFAFVKTALMQIYASGVTCL
ncbi:MAG: hypothetical protein ABJB11_22425 [Ferruginibacter sp.]